MTLSDGSRPALDESLAPIAALQRALSAEFDRDARGPRVAAILAEYTRLHDDWRAFAHFAPDRYTRNLVGRTAAYELLVLCWDAGQSSPIHDHAGQNCWMGVLEGRIEEVQYELPPRGFVGPLRRLGARVYEPGKVAYISDDIALHLVRPAHGRRGVSLHLYAQPIATCHVYDEATGLVLPRELTYHTA
ncbi:MAG: cysteine dioxygenase family protein [Planctomycetota bacterium]|nr:cysteine dioxygenase family protein [Planctomycetota bacterium]